MITLHSAVRTEELLSSQCPLTADAIQLLARNQFREFYQAYGDGLVNKVVYGKKLIAVLEFNELDYEQLTRDSVELNTPLIKLPRLGIEADWHFKLKKLISASARKQSAKAYIFTAGMSGSESSVQYLNDLQKLEEKLHMFLPQMAQPNKETKLQPKRNERPPVVQTQAAGPIIDESLSVIAFCTISYASSIRAIRVPDNVKGVKLSAPFAHEELLQLYCRLILAVSCTRDQLLSFAQVRARLFTYKDHCAFVLSRPAMFVHGDIKKANLRALANRFQTFENKLLSSSTILQDMGLFPPDTINNNSMWTEQVMQLLINPNTFSTEISASGSPLPVHESSYSNHDESKASSSGSTIAIAAAASNTDSPSSSVDASTLTSGSSSSPSLPLVDSPSSPRSNSEILAWQRVQNSAKQLWSELTLIASELNAIDLNADTVTPDSGIHFREAEFVLKEITCLNRNYYYPWPRRCSEYFRLSLPVQSHDLRFRFSPAVPGVTLALCRKSDINFSHDGQIHRRILQTIKNNEVYEVQWPVKLDLNESVQSQLDRMYGPGSINVLYFKMVSNPNQTGNGGASVLPEHFQVTISVILNPAGYEKDCTPLILPDCPLGSKVYNEVIHASALSITYADLQSKTNQCGSVSGMESFGFPEQSSVIARVASKTRSVVKLANSEPSQSLILTPEFRNKYLHSKYPLSCRLRPELDSILYSEPFNQLLFGVRLMFSGSLVEERGTPVLLFSAVVDKGKPPSNTDSLIQMIKSYCSNFKPPIQVAAGEIHVELATPPSYFVLHGRPSAMHGLRISPTLNPNPVGLRSFILTIGDDRDTKRHIGFTCFHVAAGNPADRFDLQAFSQLQTLATHPQAFSGCNVTPKCDVHNGPNVHDRVEANGHYRFSTEMDGAVITLHDQGCAETGTTSFWTGPPAELFHQQDWIRLQRGAITYHYAVWRQPASVHQSSAFDYLPELYQVDFESIGNLAPFACNHLQTKPVDAEDVTIPGDCGALLFVKRNAQNADTRSKWTLSGKFNEGQDVIPMSFHRFASHDAYNNLNKMLSIQLDEYWLELIQLSYPTATQHVISFRGHGII